MTPPSSVSSCSCATARPVRRRTDRAAPTCRPSSPTGHVGSGPQAIGHERAVGFGDDERQPRVGGDQRPERLGVEMVGVVVARRDDVDEVEARRVDRRARSCRTCGLSVLAYFAVSESDRYGSSRRWRPSPLHEEAALPEPPEAQRVRRARRRRRRRRGTRRPSSTGSITAAPQLRRAPRRTPSTMFASFCRAAQRAVWLRPQSGAKASRSAGAYAQAAAHAVGDVLGRLDVVALHVDDADRDVHALGDRARSARSRRTRGWPSRRGSRRPFMSRNAGNIGA